MHGDSVNEEDWAITPVVQSSNKLPHVQLQCCGFSYQIYSAKTHRGKDMYVCFVYISNSTGAIVFLSLYPRFYLNKNLTKMFSSIKKV